MKQLLSLLSIVLLAASCANGPDTGETITVAGVMGTAKKNGVKNHSSISFVSLTGLNFVCTAFDAIATKVRSDFGDDGSFSVNVPANTPFGCAVVNKTTDAVVASIKIKDTNTGMEDKSSSSMALKSSVNMGALTLTDGVSVVEVPIAKVAASQATTISKFSINDIHNTSWKMTCVDGRDTACTDFVNESPTIFLRVVQASKDGAPIYGLGVWATQSAFTTCGSIDMTTEDKSGIEADEDDSGEFTWITNVTAATFSNATSVSSACKLRDDGAAVNNSHNWIQDYYTMSKLVINGNIFSINDEDEDNSDPNCYYYHKTAVTFSPQNSTTMMGSFETAEVVGDKDSCGDTLQDDKATFVVKFTKQ